MHTFTKRRADIQTDASSMADIAFLMLVFFLATATIDIEKGIRIQLPEFDHTQPPPIQARNIFSIKINFNDEIIVRGEPVEIYQIKSKAKEFIMNPAEDENLSAAPNQAVISLQNDRSTTYNIYISVYNELKAAYNELWEEESQKTFGNSFESLSRSKREQVKNKIPMVISEGEIVDLQE